MHIKPLLEWPHNCRRVLHITKILYQHARWNIIQNDHQRDEKFPTHCQIIRGAHQSLEIARVETRNDSTKFNPWPHQQTPVLVCFGVGAQWCTCHHCCNTLVLACSKYHVSACSTLFSFPVHYAQGALWWLLHCGIVSRKCDSGQHSI